MDEQNIQSTQEISQELENTDQIGQNKENFELSEINNSQPEISVSEQENFSNTNEKINLGKFKDVSSLLTAYNNLQAEFTKKCQKLSEISKKVAIIAKIRYRNKKQSGQKSLTLFFPQTKMRKNIPEKFPNF